MSRLVRLAHRRDDTGASASEYALLAAGVAALIVSIVFVFGGAVRNSFDKSCGIVSAGAAASSTSTC